MRCLSRHRFWSWVEPTAHCFFIRSRLRQRSRAPFKNLQSAMASAQVEETFLPAVAVGTVEHWIANAYYPSDEPFCSLWPTPYTRSTRPSSRPASSSNSRQPQPAGRLRPYTHLDVPAYHTFQELRIAALNRSIAGLPASRIRMHVCWGAHKGPHNTDIPLKDIVDLMLDVQVEAYSVEAANPRHAHEWYLWEHVKLPAGKISSRALSATTPTRSSTRSWWQNASATMPRLGVTTSSPGRIAASAPAVHRYRASEVADAGGRRAPGLAEALEPLEVSA